MEKQTKLPAIRAQKFHVCDKVRRHLAKTLSAAPKKIHVAYSVRPFLLINTRSGSPGAVQYDARFDGQNILDAVFFLEGPGTKPMQAKLALVLCEDEAREFTQLADWLATCGISLLVESAANILRDEGLLNPSRKLTAKGGDFINSSEGVVFRSALMAIQRAKEFLPASIVGQIDLRAIAPEFDGFHSKGGCKPSTDCDLLLTTAPPVALPLLAIEIDGPTHRSDELGANKDLVKNTVLENAEIPLLRIRVDAHKDFTFFEKHAMFFQEVIYLALKTLKEGGFVSADIQLFFREMACKARDYVNKHFISEPAVADSIELSLLHAEELEAKIDSMRTIQDALSDHPSYDEHDLAHDQQQYGEYYLAEELTQIRMELEKADSNSIHKFVDLVVTERVDPKAHTMKFHLSAHPRYASEIGAKKSLWDCEIELPHMQFYGVHAELLSSDLLEAILNKVRFKESLRLQHSPGALADLKKKIADEIKEYGRAKEVAWHMTFDSGPEKVLQKVERALVSAVLHELCRMKVIRKVSPPLEPHSREATKERLAKKWSLPKPKYLASNDISKGLHRWSEGLIYPDVTTEDVNDLVSNLDEVSIKRISDLASNLLSSWLSAISSSDGVESGRIDITDLRKKVEALRLEFHQGK